MIAPAIALDFEKEDEAFNNGPQRALYKENI
jgi:hypothetical protein